MRFLVPLAAYAGFLAVTCSVAWAASPPPSGERDHGQSTLEPVYNDENPGRIGYIMTPNKAQFHASPAAWSPLYLVVYPVGSEAAEGGLICQDVPVENCPSHGAAIAGLAQTFNSATAAVYRDGVAGHDHLMDFHGGAEWNVAWEPVVVLFTNSQAAMNDHLSTDAQIDTAVMAGDAIEVPLPQLAFHCEQVSVAIWNRASPVGS